VFSFLNSGDFEGVDVEPELARLRGMALRVAMLLLCLVLSAAAGAARDVEAHWVVHDLTRQEAKTLASSPAAPQTPARAAATWCGTPVQADLAPNAVAGSPVHWVYAIPSDGPDRFGTYGSLMQSDAESIDAWWRGQDPLRTPRNDLAPFSCGPQLDLTLFRLSQSSSQLGSVDARFGAITASLMARGFGSRHTKYLVYYDGPVEPDICGQGGSNSTGLGFAVVYVQACPGVPLNTTAAHELLHTLGAVSSSAPHSCPEPDDGHTCDNPLDMMYPFGDETPITGLVLDSGRDDYYGHAGAWPRHPGLALARPARPPGAVRAHRLGIGLRDRGRPWPALQPELHDDLERGYGARAERNAGDRHEARQLGGKLLRPVDLQSRRRAREDGVRALRSGDLPARGCHLG